MLKILKNTCSRLALIPVCFCALSVVPATAASVNPGVVEIDYPGEYVRIIAVSDIHGMYASLQVMLRSARLIDTANNWTAGKTLLIVVGDSIDKGPDSLDTIDLWMRLQQQAPLYGGRLIHSLGNHEAEFLSDPKRSNKTADFREELKAKGVRLKELTVHGYPRADFLFSMPVAVRVGKWLFCHSGLLPDKSWRHFTAKAAEVVQSGNYGAKFLSGADSILENGNWWMDSTGRGILESRLSDNDLFGVVFGHRSKALNAEGRNAISQDRRLIKIDNGMAPEAGAHPGSLLVFPHPVDLSSAAPASVQTILSGGLPKPLRP
ncbi:MAG TPA: hypothetical protein DCL44_06985 [Elusimicrobia bacterium]|nr:hypothetical protein [Elusimicrobiota bacterium]